MLVVRGRRPLRGPATIMVVAAPVGSHIDDCLAHTLTPSSQVVSTTAVSTMAAYLASQEAVVSCTPIIMQYLRDFARHSKLVPTKICGKPSPLHCLISP